MPLWRQRIFAKAIFSGTLYSIFISFVDKLNQCDLAGHEGKSAVRIPYLIVFLHTPLPHIAHTDSIDSDTKKRKPLLVLPSLI